MPNTILKLGESKKITATCTYDDGRTDHLVRWSSDNPTVVSIDSTTGMMSGLTAGNAIITAESVYPNADGHKLKETRNILVTPATGLITNADVTVLGRNITIGKQTPKPRGGCFIADLVFDHGSLRGNLWAYSFRGKRIKVEFILNGVARYQTYDLKYPDQYTFVTLPYTVDEINTIFNIKNDGNTDADYSDVITDLAISVALIEHP